MDRERIAELIRELDQLVPAEDAKVLLTQVGGGPDESKVVATENGYLRFGLAFMKAAFAPPSKSGDPATIHVDLEDLISDDSDVSFDWFERVDHFAPPGKESGAYKVAEWALIGSCVMVPVLVITGIVAIVDRLFR